MAINRSLLRGLLVGLCCFSALAQADIHRSHAMAMHGSPKYPAGFQHLDYVNPEAPKGGKLRRHVIGTFDSLNPFVPKGTAAAGIGSLVYDTLTTRAEDEPFTQYGLLAETIEWPEDRSWVRFHLNPKATFSDGEPVQASDVLWTFNTLINDGAPFYSFYYSGVDHVTADDEHTVTFHFKPGDNRELALIIGQLPVLPEHVWKTREFTSAGLEKPIGSGPYSVGNVDTGKQITFQRRKDYWAKDLPIMRGRNNFDTVSFDYFLDDTVALQAFKRGDYDWRFEVSSKNWATSYKGPAFDQGKLVKEEVPHSNPAGMQGIVYNLRNPLFQNVALREAMTYALDFEWSNANLFYGQYNRTRSYFQNSDMAATGLPSEAELKLLEPLRDDIPERVFTESYEPPKSDGSGRPRANLARAQTLLKKAGYKIREGQLHSPDGTPVSFQIMLHQPAFERILLPFARNLKALGIDAQVVKVDTSQYVERIRNFNFDMVVSSFAQSSSPGNEQLEYWGSDAAEDPSSRNIIGIQNPAVDTLVDAIVTATTRDQLITACRALDRVLQWNFYVIPNWYADHHRLSYRSRLKHPSLPEYVGIDGAIDTWWDSNAQ